MMATATATGVVVRRSLPSSARAVTFDCPTCGESQTLRLHADAKTAPRGVWGTAPTATYANAFHLPSGLPSEGGGCDGATEYCLHYCYASAMERRFVAFKSGAVANLEILRHVYGCAGGDGLRVALRALVGHAVEHQTRDGLAPTFRWHSDGDCWLGDRASSDAYARAIRAVSSEFGASHGLRAWIYTRSLGRVRHLVGSDHLAVYVSADPDNVARATATATRHGARLAILGDDSEHVRAMLSDTGYASRVVACPATGKYARDGRGASYITGVSGRRDMVRGDVVRGACDACAVCVVGCAGVSFVRKHGGA